MFKNNITNSGEILLIINKYEKGDTVENIVDETGIESFEVFSVVFNYRFCFKKPNELTTAELWKLLEKPSIAA